MSDKSKPDEDKEPVDAEFETLDADMDTAPPAPDKVKPASGRWLVILVGIGLVIGLVLIARFVIFTGNAPAKPATGVDDIAALTLRLETLQDDVKALHLQTKTNRAEVQARLTALESVPEHDLSSTSELDDLQIRLTALENAITVDANETTNLQALVQRLDRLDGQILAITTNPGSTDTDTRTRQNILDRIATLESAVPNTGSDQSGTEPNAQLDVMQSEIVALRSRITSLEDRGSTTKNKTKLVLDLLALETAAQNGAPFEREWQSLSQILPQNADVLLLAPLARTGVPGRAELTRDFNTRISAIRASSGQNSGKQAGMMAKAKTALGSLVSVRRVDGRAAGVDAVLTTVEAALESGDLNGAITALGNLDDSARKAAQGWLTQAQARLTLEQALARLKVLTAEVNP